MPLAQAASLPFLLRRVRAAATCTVKTASDAANALGIDSLDLLSPLSSCLSALISALGLASCLFGSDNSSLRKVGSGSCLRAPST